MELLSGPDLGGGFMFQLQAERLDGRARVTFHAQEGGLEAATPPKGPLTALGFEAHPGSCPIGGRECYHREFEVPVGELGRVRMTYNRTRFVVGPSMDQRYGSLVPPVESALADVVERLAPLANPTGAGWFLGGSAAAWVQGVPIPPKDLDLGTDRPGVDAIAEALNDFLIEPPSPTRWGAGRAVYGARAFVGSLVNGVRVEWAVAEPGGTAPERWTEWSRPFDAVPLRTVAWNGKQVPVARLEFFVARCAARRDAPMVRTAARQLVAVGPDETLFEELALALPAADGRRMRDALDEARGRRVEG